MGAFLMPRPIRIAYTIPYGAQFGAIRAGGARRHQGCDYHCPIGTPIYGTGDGGVVVARGYQPDPNSGAGNYVTISYPNHRTTDMHMREASPLRNGAHVDAQTIVGYVGLTGNAVNASPPGSHDHHQLTVGGILTDPEVYYGTAPAASELTPIVPAIKESNMPILYIEPNGNPTLAWDDYWTEPNAENAAMAVNQFEIRHVTTAEANSVRAWCDYIRGLRLGWYGGAPQVDTASLAKALTPLLTAGASAESVAAAVQQKLAADFAAVNANIDDQPTTFVIQPK